jgi:hypothetical protein
MAIAVAVAMAMATALVAKKEKKVQKGEERTRKSVVEVPPSR